MIDTSNNTSTYLNTQSFRYKLSWTWQRPWRDVTCPECSMRVSIEPRLVDELEAEGGIVHCGRGHAFSLAVDHWNPKS